MHVVILSPHRDDAAFSCGLTMQALLRAGASITVANVFTESDYAVDHSTVDATLPLVYGVSRARLLEDEAFLAAVAGSAGVPTERVRLRDLHWLDAPLRLLLKTEQVLASPLSEEETDRQSKALAGQLHGLREFDAVFAPMALGDHIDHRIAREAARLAVPASQLCWYEDQPYTGRLAAQERKRGRDLALPSTTSAEFRRWALHLPGGPHLRRRFAGCYPSQIAMEVADEMASYAAAGSTGGSGAEHWWAQPALAQHVRDFLRDSQVACSLVEEWQD